MVETSKVFIWILLVGTSVFFAHLFLRRYKKSDTIFEFPHVELLSKIAADLCDHVCSRLVRVASFVALLAMGALLASCLLGFVPQPFSGAISSTLWPKSTTATLFVVDCSGSMNEPLSLRDSLSKIAVVREALYQTIEKLDQNVGYASLIGIDAFARLSWVQAPLSYDRTFVLERVQKLEAVSDARWNGTATGYALFKALLQIIASRTLENGKHEGLKTRCVLISDGIEEPHPDDLNDTYRSLRVQEALKLAYENNIVVDYLFLGPEWNALSADERQKLIGAVERTGGSLQNITFSSALSSSLMALLYRHDGQVRLELPFIPQEAQFFLLIVAFACSTLFLVRVFCLLMDLNKSDEARIA